MAAQTIYNEIDLSNNQPETVNLNGAHNFYLIAVAQDDKISSITFGTYVDSGVSNNPLLMEYITLPVNVGVSGRRWCGWPNEFFIKPTQVILKNGEVKKGNIDGKPYQVEINISPIDLG